MRDAVLANLIADVIWLPLGALLLWLARSLRREIRQALAEAHEVLLLELSERVAAAHDRLDALEYPRAAADAAAGGRAGR